MFELGTGNAAEYLAKRDFKCRSVEALGGGVSNTVLAVETDRGRMVLKQSLGKLRVEQDWFSDRSRIFRESESMNAIQPFLPPGSVPSILFEDRDNYLFAMTAAPAGARTWKSLLLEGSARPEIADAAGAMLGDMIRLSWRKPDWERRFGDQTVFEQLRLDPYYRSTSLRHPDLKPFFDALIAETQARRVSLVHGDWSPKNFLVDSVAVMAIDFEVVHFGDPSFDSAFLLNHLVLKSFFRPERAGLYAEAALRFWGKVLSRLPDEADWFKPATLRHLGGLLLARIDGKSPAEYIQSDALKHQIRRFAREVITMPPSSVAGLFDSLPI